MKTILFVDDEAQILKSLRRLFADTGYGVRVAGSGAEALGICSSEHIDLVVSDMRMPEMSGAELLALVKRDYPRTLRMMLSGYLDEAAVAAALQQNVAMACLLKPWDNEELIRTIGKVFETMDRLASKQMLGAINSMEQLPTLKPYLQDILQAIDADEDISVISGKIERDHSVAAKALHIVNSAYYGVKTGSVKKAVSFLGLHSTRGLILSTSVMDAFEVRGNGKRFAENVWAHSFLANRMLQAILRHRMQPAEFQMACSAGLLHNIGIVFLMRHDPGRYLELVAESLSNPDMTLSDLEKDRFGFTHAEAGGYLLQWWNLPFPAVEAALYHCDPANPCVINKTLVCAMHVAQHQASVRLGMKPDCSLHPEACACLNISREQLEAELAGSNPDGLFQ